MAISTENSADTTNKKADMDLIGELLRAMQVSGSVLLNESYLAPWAVSIPNHKLIAESLGFNRGTHIAAFHLVQRGSVEILLEDGTHDTAYEGEILICYSGQGHTIYQGSSEDARPFEEIMQHGLNPFEPAIEKEAHATSLLCGIFQLQDTERNPLFAALPAILKLSTRQARLPAHPATKIVIELLLNEMAQPSFAHGYIVERYLELLCARSIGAHIEAIRDDDSGWLHAIKDPTIARVINAIHSHPSHPWTVAAMAELTTLSPSRFAAIFTHVMGMSPMVYATQWRMYLASKLLKRPKSSIEKIASTTGYENVAAFSRAFKRTMGKSPGVWRADHRLL